MIVRRYAVSGGAARDGAPVDLLSRCEVLTKANMQKIYEEVQWENSYTGVVGYCSKSKLLELQEDGVLICAWDDEQCTTLLGCVKVAKINRWMGFVMELQVLGQFQRQGIGRALMDAAAKVCAHEFKAREIELCVQRVNSDAARFYERLGFAKRMDDPGYFIYGKRLNAPD